MSNITYVVGDLFQAPQGFCLAHCISADFVLGAGIAVQFNKKFNMKERLKDQWGNSEVQIGDVIKIDNVYNLITKEHSYEKPTYDSLQKAVQTMIDLMKDDGVKKVAMPKIGAGLDRLKWNVVLAIIKDAFEKTDIEVVIYFLPNDNDFPNANNDSYISYDKDEDVRCNKGYMDDYIF